MRELRNPPSLKDAAVSRICGGNDLFEPTLPNLSLPRISQYGRQKAGQLPSEGLIPEISQMLFERLRIRGHLNTSTLWIFATKGLAPLTCMRLGDLSVPVQLATALLSAQSATLRHLTLDVSLYASRFSSTNSVVSKLSFPRLVSLKIKDVSRGTIHLPRLVPLCPNLHTLAVDCSGADIPVTQSIRSYIEKLDPSVLPNLSFIEVIGLPCLQLRSGWESRQRQIQGFSIRPTSRLDLCMDRLTSFTNLSVLDVSGTAECPTIVEVPQSMLLSIVTNMRNLEQLDVSFTNLTYDPACDGDPSSMDCGISFSATLRKLNRRLKFLGCYWCDYFWKNSSSDAVLADEVAAFRSAVEILCAVRRYRKRFDCLKAVFDDMTRNDSVEVRKATPEFLQIISGTMYEKCEDADYLGKLIFGLGGFVKKKNITPPCVIRVLRFLVTKYLNSPKLSFPVIYKFVELLLYLEHDTIESDPDFYCRLMCQLLVEPGIPEHLLSSAILHMHNLTVCISVPQQAEVVHSPKIRCFEKLFRVINRRVKTQKNRNRILESDRIMETCWSVMWNLTDENEQNCEAFIKKSGLQLVLDAIQACPDEIELVVNVTGLLGNISEVPRFRVLMITDHFLEFFVDNLEKYDQKTAVGYNSAGVLCNLLVETTAWTGRKTDRALVIDVVHTSVASWKVTQNFYMKFKSLKPVLRLLGNPDTCAWSVFVIANLTTLNLDKDYCQMCIDEDALVELSKMSLAVLPLYIRGLMQVIVRNIKNHASTLGESAWSQLLQKCSYEDRYVAEMLCQHAIS